MPAGADAAPVCAAAASAATAASAASAIAISMARLTAPALCSVSSNSFSGTEPATMPAPDGEVDAVVLDHGRADRDRRVEVAVVAEIAHGAAVQPAPLPLELGDDLHSPNLRRARKRSGREDAAQRVQGVAARLESRLHVAHQMQHVAVPLDLHVLGHGHGSGAGHAAQVVAAQVHEHHVLGPLLGVVLEAVAQGVVLGGIGAARPRARDRVRGDAVALHADQQLRAGAHDGELRHAYEEEVRAGVDAAQRTVERDGVEALPADHGALERLRAARRRSGSPRRRRSPPWRSGRPTRTGRARG